MQYTVQGQRADRSGPVSPVFTGNCGRLPGGGLTAQVAGAVREGLHAAADRTSDKAVVDAVINSKPLGSGHPTRERAPA